MFLQVPLGNVQKDETKTTEVIELLDIYKKYFQPSQMRILSPLYSIVMGLVVKGLMVLRRLELMVVTHGIVCRCLNPAFKSGINDYFIWRKSITLPNFNILILPYCLET